ncbi:MAG: hypothetical protein HOK28_13330 [Deltaproteobacteria bacterium]|nr:hypothetical protein [Deltaproteobacteria bacterium]
MTQIEQGNTLNDGPEVITERVCDSSGDRVYRKTTNRIKSTTNRVIDFAGFAEIRPDDGVVLFRMPVNGSVVIEEARNTINGTRNEEESGYIHQDIRGSVLSKTSFTHDWTIPQLSAETEYDAWVNDYENRLSRNLCMSHLGGQAVSF